MSDLWADVIERLTMWLEHRVGCDANDLDPLNDTACTCGLRHAMADIRLMLNPPPARAMPEFDPLYQENSDRWDYREEQARLRAAGFDAYNCDMVDEFPRW